MDPFCAGAMRPRSGLIL